MRKKQKHPLAIWRDEVGLTQRDLARKLGVHVVTVAKWECGMEEVGLPLLRKIYKLTTIHPSTLRPDLAAVMR